MSWEADIEELRRREALARQMGGPDKVKRQHDAGRLTVRERIEHLLDPGSFHEIGALAGRAVNRLRRNYLRSQAAAILRGSQRRR